jgi:hypothetical protein
MKIDLIPEEGGDKIEYKWSNGQKDHRESQRASRRDERVVAKVGHE